MYVKSRHAQAGRASSRDDRGELRVPDAVFARFATRVHFAAVPVPEAWVHAQRDVATGVEGCVLLDLERRAQVHGAAVLHEHGERRAIEEVGRVHDRVRLESGA